MGTAVQSAITYQQGNRFTNNTYTGDWQFVAFQPGAVVSFAAWQAGPNSQDAGSSLNAPAPAPAPPPAPTPPPPASDPLSALLAGLGALLGHLHL
jgi:hypothetical protein